MDRWFQAGQLRPFGRHRQVWWVQRREGLTPSLTIADVANDYAVALRGRFDGPVDVLGSSTGGSVALQLAADHPQVVHRLVLVCSACRLGPEGRHSQRSLAELLRRGRTRQASALSMSMSMLAHGERSKWVLAKLGWLLGSTLEGDVSDMLITIDAEDAFDLTHRLQDITTPTLVIGGAKDRYYGAELFRETASGLPSGRLLLLPDKGHFGTQTSRKTSKAVLHFLDEQ